MQLIKEMCGNSYYWYTCPGRWQDYLRPLIKSVSHNEVFERNKVPSSNVIASNVPAQIIDFAGSGGKLILLDERDKFLRLCRTNASPHFLISPSTTIYKYITSWHDLQVYSNMEEVVHQRILSVAIYKTCYIFAGAIVKDRVSNLSLPYAKIYGLDALGYRIRRTNMKHQYRGHS